MEIRTVGQSSGKPCVTETCRDSSALIAPSVRQVTTTAKVASSDGDPCSAESSLGLLLSVAYSGFLPGRKLPRSPGPGALPLDQRFPGVLNGLINAAC